MAQFVEQSRVLDGDDGLGGEVLDEINLLVSKREHLGAIDYNSAHQLVLFQHRDRKLDACPGVHRYSRRVGAPSNAATRYRVSPSQRNKTPNLAPQIRTAFASTELNTGSNSPLDELITLSTSDVAVCCSSDSCSSLVRCCSASNSRTFSMAITAWSANVVTSSICLSVNGSTVLRVNTNTPFGVPSRSMGTPRTVRTLANPDPPVSFISGSALASTT